MGRVSDMIIEREHNISFEKGVDKDENPAFYWINPWSGQRELVAIYFWPTHPFEDTEYIEALWENLELRITPQEPTQSQPADREVVEALEGLLEINSIRHGSEKEPYMQDYYESRNFPQFDHRKHGFDDIEEWALERVRATLAKLKERQS